MVIWTEPAKQDLKSIYDYIARDSIYYARTTIQQILNLAEVISEQPNMGKIVLEVKSDSIREMPVHSYRLIYKVNTLGIIILTVIHSKRIFRRRKIGS